MVVIERLVAGLVAKLCAFGHIRPMCDGMRKVRPSFDDGFFDRRAFGHRRCQRTGRGEKKRQCNRRNQRYAAECVQIQFAVPVPGLLRVYGVSPSFCMLQMQAATLRLAMMAV